jgi:hypothetical protein
LKQAHDRDGVLVNIVVITREIGHSQQIRELAEDGRLVGLAPTSRRSGCRILLTEDHGREG